MLNVNISKSYNGSSTINGTIAATMYANVSETGDINLSKNIVDKELYSKNKDEVRKDMNDFENTVFSEQEDK